MSKGDTVPFEDMNLQCVNCKKMFMWMAGEQAFFKKMGFPAPKRCQVCRKQMKQQSQALNG